MKMDSVIIQNDSLEGLETGLRNLIYTHDFTPFLFAKPSKELDCKENISFRSLIAKRTFLEKP